MYRYRPEWSGTKRRENLRPHGLDFADAAGVFADVTLTYEDARFDYGERRFVTLGLIRGSIVSIVHTEVQARLRIISFRKATRREQAIFLQGFEN